MIKRILVVFVLNILAFQALVAQKGIDYYFPEKIDLDPDIPPPEEYLGFQVGEKHVSHERLVGYMTALADVSDRIQTEIYGYTHEGRPLLLLTVSSSENLKDIEMIRQRHLSLTDPESPGNAGQSNRPLVIWMGYSVHGNEASGSNASLLVAYYLAANRSAEMDSILTKTIILIDPCINPDGYSRFAQWINQYRSKVTITDPNSIELNEPWPGGRTNHYWVDLNRDWLLLQQPESRARLAKFYDWLPNILTDHHEMGSDQTFFFQPGIPSRNNPETPALNFILTNKIAAYHARALDRIGSLYYARESFDDFYYGKGSTYPDINGGIGILFEQASSRGYSRMTGHGPLTFRFTIRNQLTTSISTLQAGYELHDELLDYQQEFYRIARNEAGKDLVKAYVIDPQGDQIKFEHFVSILEQHQIKIYTFSGDADTGGHRYEGGKSFVVPTDQRQYKLIRNLFEHTTEFSDSLFYDVSAWTLPPAFDLKYGELNEKQFRGLSLTPYAADENISQGKLNAESQYGYLIRWDRYNAPGILYILLEKGVHVWMAESSFITTEGDKFDPGTLFIPVQTQEMEGNALRYVLAEAAKKTGMDVYPVSTGYTQEGINLGSPRMTLLKKPNILLLVGEGISSSEAGEVWHLFDVRFGIPVSLVTLDKLNEINLNGYNTIVMVNGNYGGISGEKKNEMKTWLEHGGNIVAFKGAARWLASQKFAFLDFRNSVPDTLSQKNYGDLDKDRGSQEIGGAIFRTRLDLTHPLCYGFPDDELFIFKNGKYFLERSKNPYNHPVVFENEPLLSGYVSKENYEKIKNSSEVAISVIGRGRTICFTDDPVFRDYWYGSDRLFLNAIFLGSLIQAESAR